MNDFEMIPVSPVITGIASVFTFHMRFVCGVRSLVFGFFLVHIYYYYYYYYCGYYFFSPGATTPIGGCILQPSSGL